MRCPRCESVDLVSEKRGKHGETVETDICPSCHGLWLDASELKRLDDNFFVDLETIEYRPSTPSSGDAEVRCPRCVDHPVLRKVHPSGYKTVVVDICPICRGYWLDKDELAKLRLVSDKLLISSLD